MTDNFLLQKKPSSPHKHILLKKMKHISQIDRQIRSNWKKLFKNMNEYECPDPQNSFCDQRIKTQHINPILPRKNSSPIKMILKKNSLKRQQQVHERKRKNQQIFYRKRSIEMPSFSRESQKFKQTAQQNNQQNIRASKKLSGNDDQSRKKFEQNIPFMLRKRALKTQKEMNIIDHDYSTSLQKIKIKQEQKCLFNFQQQRSLINRMKGTKLYYQFVRQWKPPIEETK